MSAPTNVERVQQIYAAFGRGDVQTILNTLTPDVTWDVQGPSWLPLFGARRGRHQAAQFFQAVQDKLAIDEFAPHDFIADGDRVVVIGRERGRAVPTGRSYQIEWVHVFTFRDGLVAGFREFSDTSAYVDAFRPAAQVA